MLRWPWRKGGTGRSAAPAVPEIEDGLAPPAVGGARPPAPAGPAGTWQEVLHSGNANVTGSDGAFVNTGIYSSTVQLPPGALRPPAEVDAPADLDDLPRQPGPFVGRGNELGRLDAALAAPGAVLVQAVHGLGGIGKSTLAAHWAATRPHGHAPVRWITADSRAAVRQGLVDLAIALQPALSRALTAEALAEWGLQWLAGHTGWLIVLDNVNDPADIASLIARARTGRFLITSRLATVWSDATTLVRLDVLEPAEALALLTRTATTQHAERDLDGAAELCDELGHLPLAIEQAAAYLAQNPLTTPRAYLHLLTQYPAKMFRQGAATTPSERTIARIWNITLDRITHLQPAAADLLRTLAWYAPDHIPTALAALADPPVRDEALGLLTAYSMITPDPATGTLAVHRLVQALARTPDPSDLHRAPHQIGQAREQAIANLSTSLPASSEDPGSWRVWRALLPHIEALADRTTVDADTVTTVRIFHGAGIFLAVQGLPNQAIGYLRRCLTAQVRLLGRRHPDTLACRNSLAYAYRSAGDLDHAIPLYEQNLKAVVWVLGRKHPDTLSSRNNLAYAYQSAGDLGRAIPLHEQTLKDRIRLLGTDHPATLTSRNNLALAYETAGDLGRAIPLHEQTLKDRIRLLGTDHPATLTSRNNLAGAYASAGDLGRAIPLHEQALEGMVKVLGEAHPTTLTSGNNLAGVYASVGDLGRAILLYEQILTDALRGLGEEHSITVVARENLTSAIAERDGRTPPS
ncbi:tetratricopeptide repeat protein [Streptomyces sp. NPDC002623]